MYYKVIMSIFLTVYLPELSLSMFQYTKSVNSIKTVPNIEEATLPDPNTSFRLTEKLFLRKLIPDLTVRRVKRNLPMGQRCSTDMREYADRCWPIDKYYDLSGMGETMKNLTKWKKYEKEAIYLMKELKYQYRRCAKIPCRQFMKN